MTYTTFPTNASMTDSMGWVFTNVPMLIPLMQFALFSLILIVGYSAQLLKRGKASFPAWVAVAQMVNTFASLILLMVPNMISMTNILINATLLIVFVMWLLFSQDADQ